MKGYWRINQDSDEIFECDYKELCLSGANKTNNTCYEGHLGALCGACDIENKLGILKGLNFQAKEVILRKTRYLVLNATLLREIKGLLCLSL